MNFCELRINAWISKQELISRDQQNIKTSIFSFWWISANMKINTWISKQELIWRIIFQKKSTKISKTKYQNKFSLLNLLKTCKLTTERLELQILRENHYYNPSFKTKWPEVSTLHYLQLFRVIFYHHWFVEILRP